MDFGYMLGMSKDTCLARLQRDVLSLPEYLLATGERELVDEFNVLWLGSIVLDLSINKHGVACLVIPDMNSKRLDTYSIGFDKRDRTEDAEGL